MNNPVVEDRAADDSPAARRAAHGGDLEVRGGAGGITARLDDMEHAAGLLGAVAVRLAEVARRVLGVAADPALAVTALRAPVSYSRAEASLGSALVGADGVLALAGRVELLSRALALVAGSYAAADAAAAVGMRTVQLSIGRTLGTLAGRLLAPAVLAASAAAAVALVTGRRFGETDRSTSRGGGSVSPAVGEPVALQRLGAVTLWLLGRNGPAVEFAAATSPGVLAGVLEVAPPAGLVWSGTAGQPWPPRTVGDLTGYAASLGRVSAWFDERTAVQVRADAPVAGRPPAGTADVVGRIPISARGASTVHVEQVADSDGRRAWVVAVPGTSDWDPVPGPVPLDLTGNVHVLAGRRTAAAEAVVAAMHASGIRNGEPVLLAGHSQGGLVAAALAADPDFRQHFSVTHVVTAGAPVSGTPGPEGVRMLSLEHTDDIVPRLDGGANPDRASWVTASRPSTADPAIAARILHEPGLAHSLPAYMATAGALDDSTHASILAWREGLEVFLDRPGASSTARQVEVVRRPAA